jgi:hypothetical protein
VEIFERCGIVSDKANCEMNGILFLAMNSLRIVEEATETEYGEPTTHEEK